jgi:hypothetical protein
MNPHTVIPPALINCRTPDIDILGGLESSQHHGAQRAVALPYKDRPHPPAPYFLRVTENELLLIPSRHVETRASMRD